MSQIYTEKSERKIVLDTETTGKNDDGTPGAHRIIEIGCVEIIGRKPTGRIQQIYINPERLVDEEAYNVHHISDEFLSDKPKFSQIFDEFFDFINGAELVIHNARFDVGFLNNEFVLSGKKVRVEDICEITDTLEIAKKLFPGQKINLNALCSKLNVDNSSRTSHGALLDAEILSEVYLAMTGGQSTLNLDSSDVKIDKEASFSRTDLIGESKLRVIKPNNIELGDHCNFLISLSNKTDKILFGDEFYVEKKEGMKKISSEQLNDKIQKFLTTEQYTEYKKALELRAQDKKKRDLSGIVDYNEGNLYELK